MRSSQLQKKDIVQNGDSGKVQTPRPTQTRVPLRRRNKPIKVASEKITFWDKAPPRSLTREEVIQRFCRAAERWKLLDKYELLYQYSPIEDNEVRLLYLNPALKFEDDIFVSLKIHTDKDVGPRQQEYEALSYHWGPGPADKPIYLSEPRTLPRIDVNDLCSLQRLVEDFKKGQRFYVRPNLDKALRYLRHKTDVMPMWVRAVCINQADETIEKPAQIAKIKHIYRKATNVCIWLGDGKGNGDEDRSEDFYAVMDFVKRIVNDLNNFDDCLNDKLTKSWSDMLDLMRCGWFSRRWVIQELALARDASVHCGTKEVPWRDFADAIGLFVYNSERIRDLFRQSQDEKIFRNYKYFNELEPLGAKVLVEAITNTFRKSADGDVFEPVFSLEALVSSLAAFETSDPRDSIFALLNIARDPMLPAALQVDAVGPPKPNYRRDLLEVYTDFVEWVVVSTGSLDIICRQWAAPERKRPGGRKNPTALVTLPSWIQTIEKSTWGTQEQGFNGRVNGDSLVGRVGRRVYNASHGQPPRVRFGQRWRHVDVKGNRVDSAPPNFGLVNRTSNTPPRSPFPIGRSTPVHRLYVRGMVIDTIQWASSPVSMGVITKECLEKGGWKDDGELEEGVPDRLWRTMVADRDADGNNTPSWYHRAALHCMALADNNGHIGTSDLLGQRGFPQQRLPQIIIEYLKRVQAVTWNRKFIEGTLMSSQSDCPESLFGVGPPETQVGDCICILFGCSVPCILRRRKTGINSDYYEFIGEAYIYGRMDGEAINMLSVDDLEEKTVEFIIV